MARYICSDYIICPGIFVQLCSVFLATTCMPVLFLVLDGPYPSFNAPVFCVSSLVCYSSLLLCSRKFLTRLGSYLFSIFV